MSIHQPRYSIFKLFDSVTLLSRGEVVYSGLARAMVPYFTSVLGKLQLSSHRFTVHNNVDFVIGLQCPHHNNPADFVIDKIIDHEQEVDVAHSKWSCDP